MSIRENYEKYGVSCYYKNHAKEYVNPHKDIIQDLLLYAKKNWDLGINLLDLCSGSGEVTEVFQTENIIGCDPYTYELYMTKTQKFCYKKSFKDIVLNGLENNYDTIICSFAMHLCEESMLPMLLWQLSQKSKQLLILSPHKRPNCNGIYNWNCIQEIKKEKVTMKLYKNGGKIYE